MSTDAKKTCDLADGSTPGEPVLMPEIYADKPVDEAIEIGVVEQPCEGIDESVGFDPYDTAKLYNKKK